MCTLFVFVVENKCYGVLLTSFAIYIYTYIYVVVYILSYVQD